MGGAWRTLLCLPVLLLLLLLLVSLAPASSGFNWFGEVKPEREWDYFERDRGKKDPAGQAVSR